jgi:16S rRNA G966 N2-methylase RsmD
MIPEARIGDWEIIHQHVTEEVAEAQAWDAYMKHGDVGLKRRPRHGDYVALRRISDGTCFMSSQPFELEDNQSFVDVASGRVLVSGLGLGLILESLSRKVDHIVVLEKEEEVIQLVAPHVNLTNVEIIHADAFKWTPTEQFDWAWHDIWPAIAIRNVEEMIQICSHHKQWVDRQVCWSWNLINEQLKEKDSKEARAILSALQRFEALCYAVKDDKNERRSSDNRGEVTG